MSMSKQVAQFLWIGTPLSAIEQLCLRSFVNHGYEVHLYTYGEVANVPPGVRLLPAETILPASRIFTYQKGFGRGSYAGFASLFRYHLLHERGGWWFDSDFVSIQALPEPADLLIATSHEGSHGVLANNCALYAPPRHPLIAWLRDEAEATLRQATDIGYGQIGPSLVQRLVREKSVAKHLAPWWEFSPYPVGQLGQLAPATLSEWSLGRLRQIRYRIWEATRSDFRAGYLRQGTRALHLYNEFWRSAGRDKNARFHPFAPIERFKRRHGVPSS